MNKTIYVKKEKAERLGLDKFPNAGPNPSIKGMKKLFWGEDAFLIRSGQYVYKVDKETYYSI